MKKAIKNLIDNLTGGSAAKKQWDGFKKKNKAAIVQPFVSVGGQMRRVSDGKGYATHDEFVADGGIPGGANVQYFANY